MQEGREDAGATTVRLQDGAKRLEDVLSRLPQGVVVLDGELTVEYTNPAASRLLSVLDGRAGEPLPPDAEELPLRALARGLFDAAAEPTSHLAFVGDKIVSIEGSPAGDSDTVVFVVEDVTEQERSRIAEREFVENAAHELRTPLAAIVSVVDVLEGGAKDDLQVRDRFLAHLRAHSVRVARLSTSLLALARVHRGQQEPQLELVPLRSLLEEVIRGLRPRPGVEIRLRAPETLAALTDRDLVHHAIDNVAANAVKNTTAGEIVFEARPAAADTIELEIRDSGKGMSRGDLAHAFDRFRRGADSDREGFGLGLAIAKDAIEAVGGTIALESEQGKGVRAKIRLPGARILG